MPCAIAFGDRLGTSALTCDADAEIIVLDQAGGKPFSGFHQNRPRHAIAYRDEKPRKADEDGVGIRDMTSMHTGDEKRSRLLVLKAGQELDARTAATMRAVHHQPGPVDFDVNPVDAPMKDVMHICMAIKRHAPSDHITGVVAYLVSPAAAMVTGALHTIDGGFGA